MELIAQLKSRLQYAELKIRVLEEQLRLMCVEKDGAGGEKLYDVQMELFELGPMVGEVTVLGECECAPVRRWMNGSCKHAGSQELPANLPLVRPALPRAPDQRVCNRCGKETEVIGYEESSRRDVKPAKYFVQVTKTRKAGLPVVREPRRSHWEETANRQERKHSQALANLRSSTYSFLVPKIAARLRSP